MLIYIDGLVSVFSSLYELDANLNIYNLYSKLKFIFLYKVSCVNLTFVRVIFINQITIA